MCWGRSWPPHAISTASSVPPPPRLAGALQHEGIPLKTIIVNQVGLRGQGAIKALGYNGWGVLGM